MDQHAILTREEQKLKDTWNMQDLYSTEDAYHKEMGELREMTEEFSSLKGTLCGGADALYKALVLYEKMNLTFERLYVYANQRYHEDTTNGKYQKLSGEAQVAATEVEQSTSWLEPELLSIEENTLNQYFSQKKELTKYRRFIQQITRRREHVLDAKTEAMLSRMGELGRSPYNIFSMFNNADIRFSKVQDSQGKSYPLTLGTYISLMENKDRTLRQNAFKELYRVYGQFQNTLAAVYYANAKQADFFARERNYSNALEESLDGSEIPVSVYKNLIKTVNDHLPLMHKYVKLRKKLLDVSELHMYDVYVPVVSRPEKKYSFREAKDMVVQGLAPMGADYLSVLKEGFSHRWIDVYENEGKRTGAYSWGAYGTHPYVLMNFHGSLNDVFTLAHEMGHALHSYYSDHSQPYLDAGYRIFVAEVASTCNEALLIHDLIGRCSNKAQKRYLINYFLDQFRGTMFRQTMFAEFEMITHEKVEKGEVLTADMLKEIYLELNKKYFGEEMVCDPEIACEWARIPHFYTPFYVYQYATGFAAAISISARILKGEYGISQRYKRFLSGGCSMSPIELLKICDVDMSTPQPVEEALKVFEEYLGLLEKEE